MRKKRSIYEILDYSVLTGQETRLVGGSLVNGMLSRPHKPLALLLGRGSLRDVVQVRRMQKEVVASNADVADSYGLDPRRFLPTIALGELDRKTGEVEDVNLKLSGIVDRDRGVVIRDRAVLESYALSDEGKREFFAQGERGERGKERF